MLRDACDPPTSIVPASLENQEYTLTDDSKADYTTPSFVVTPDYCLVDYTYDIELLNAGDSAVSNPKTDKSIFVFSYTKDLTPFG